MGRATLATQHDPFDGPRRGLRSGSARLRLALSDLAYWGNRSGSRAENRDLVGQPYLDDHVAPGRQVPRWHRSRCVRREEQSRHPEDPSDVLAEESDGADQGSEDPRQHPPAARPDAAGRVPARRPRESWFRDPEPDGDGEVP